MMISATCRLLPGIVRSRSRIAANGAIAPSIWVSSVDVTASRWSPWSRQTHVMGGEAAAECAQQLGDLDPHAAPAGQAGEYLGFALAGDQRLDHRPP